jgi:hypothetical protein
MKEKFKSSVKFCANPTFSSHGTESLGRQPTPYLAGAGALVPCLHDCTAGMRSSCHGFCTPSGQHNRDTKRSYTYRDLAETNANPGPNDLSLIRAGMDANSFNHLAAGINL